MLDRDYYILLSMLETIEKIIRYTSDYNTHSLSFERSGNEWVSRLSSVTSTLFRC